MLAGQEEIYLSFVEICFFCNFFGLRAIYKIEREKQRREEIRMKKDLYDHITAYIVENQNKFYRMAYSMFKTGKMLWMRFRMQCARRWSITERSEMRMP